MVTEFKLTPAIEWAESPERVKEYRFYTANSRFFLELIDDETEIRDGMLHVIPEDHKNKYGAWWKFLYS